LDGPSRVLVGVASHKVVRLTALTAGSDFALA
jgi:hypothetical protein